jgi:hypothetical protein
MPSFATGKELAGAKGLFNRLIVGPLAGTALFNQGRTGSTLDQALRSIPSTKKTDAGRAALNELKYLGGQLLEGRTPYQDKNSPAIGTQAVLGGKPVYWAGDDYGWQQLSGGGTSLTMDVLNRPGTQDRFIQDRNYKNERSRIAQLASQDQLTKKYRVADLTKAYNAAKGEEKEKIGLEIWATTNPQLAAKLRPGQLGYNETVNAFQAQGPMGAVAKAIGNMQYANKLGETTFSPGAPAINAFEVATPFTGVSFTPPPQAGVNEVFNAATTFPGTTEAFTDPLKFLSSSTAQADQAIIKRLFERGLK